MNKCFFVIAFLFSATARALEAPVIRDIMPIYPDMALAFPQYFPDGEHILAHELNSNIEYLGECNYQYTFRLWVLSVSTTSKRVLVDQVHGYALLSPDGKHVAYQGYDPRKRKYYIATIDSQGGDTLKVHHWSDRVCYIDGWQTDGKGFIITEKELREEGGWPGEVYDYYGYLSKKSWHIDINEGHAREIAENPLLVFILKESQEHYEIFFKSGALTREVMRTPVGSRDQGAPPWHFGRAVLDENRVLLEENMGIDKNSFALSAIRFFDLRTGDSKRLVSHLQYYMSGRDLFASPDGKYVFFQDSLYDGNFIAIINTFNGGWGYQKVQWAGCRGRAAAWAPDSDRFVFVGQDISVASRSKPNTLHEVLVGSTSVAEIIPWEIIRMLHTNDPVACSSAAWSLVNYGDAAVPFLVERLRGEGADIADIMTVALVKIGSAAVSAVDNLLDDPSDIVRQRAIATLGKLGGVAASAAPNLIRVLENKDEHYWNRRAAIRTLGEIDANSSDVLPALVGALQDKDAEVREYAVAVISQISPRTPVITAALLRALSDKYFMVRQQAVNILAASHPKTEQVLEALRKMLHDELYDIREAALEVFAGKYKQEGEGWGELIEGLKYGSKLAAKAFVARPPETKEIFTAIMEVFKSDDEHVRGNVANMLIDMGPAGRETVPMLLETLKDKRWYIRYNSMLVLRKVGISSQEFITAVSPLLRDTHNKVRIDATELLKEIHTSSSTIRGE